MPTADEKLLKSTKFPKEFDEKVDLDKINFPVIAAWIREKVPKLLGNDDDVPIQQCCELMQSSKFPRIKELQLQLTPYLGADAATFCKELWSLCLSAQSSDSGVPQELVEARKAELLREQELAQKKAEIVEKRRIADETKARELDRVRTIERSARSSRFDYEQHDRHGARGRGGVRGFDRAVDTYIPDHPRRRRSSPKSPAQYTPRGRGRHSPRSPPPPRSHSPPHRNHHDRRRSSGKHDHHYPSGGRRRTDRSPYGYRIRGYSGRSRDRRSASPEHRGARGRYRDRSPLPSRSPPRRSKTGGGRDETPTQQAALVKRQNEERAAFLKQQLLAAKAARNAGKGE